MKTLLMLLVILIPAVLISQTIGINFTFENSQITFDGTNRFLEYDIYISGTTAGSNFGYLQMWVYYNTTAFGSSVVVHDGILTYSRGTLATSAYYVSSTDCSPGLYAINIEIIGQPAVALPVTPTQLVHVKMLIDDPNQTSGLSFHDSIMVGEQWTDTFEQYDPVVATDTLDETLPIELSSFTANLSFDNYVNLLWITQSETGVQGFYVYRGTSEELETALLISPLIPATNTSQPQCYLYQDSDILYDGNYYYWLQNADLDGSTEYHGPISFSFSPIGVVTPPIPLLTGFRSVYPNPFNPHLTIDYCVDKEAPTQIMITNIKGQTVTTLVDELKKTGNHTINWNAKDMDGKPCSSGVYLVRMISGDKTIKCKVTLLK